MEAPPQSHSITLDSPQSTKQWRQDFDHNRAFCKVSFLEALKRQDNELEPLDAFLRSTPSSVPSFQVEALESFFKADQKSRASTLPIARAWMDRRTLYQGPPSCVLSLMTAPQFARNLEEKVRKGSGYTMMC